MQKPTELKDKIAQLLMVRIGSNMPPAKRVDADEARISELIAQYPIGGLCLFNGLYPNSLHTLTKLQAECKFPLLVGTDMERGLGQQVRPATMFPHVMAFQAMPDAEAKVEEFARLSAREALASGIHIAFAPVADVSRNPKNPIIATRAFSTKPDEAGQLASAFVRGCKAEGLLSCAKHFPGHGNTDKDSHDEFLNVSASREELDAFDLPPFQACVDAGAELVMTAHVGFPALDDPEIPATGSKKILVDLLRGEMGFKGTVITDSLLMGGIGGHDKTEAELMASLVMNGADCLLDVKDVPHIVEGIAEMVAAGTVSEARIDEALDRIWALKTHFIHVFGADFFTNPAKYFPDVQIGSVAMQAHADDMAQSAITVHKTGNQPKDAEGISFPLHAEDAVCAILIKPFNTPLDPPEQPFAQALRDIFSHVTYHEFSPDTTDEAIASVLIEAKSFKQVVLAPIVKPAAWHKFGLSDRMQAFTNALIAQQSVVLASLGSPELFNMCQSAAVHLCTFSDMPPSQRALSKALIEYKG
jgi:beta-glucosidase-like glycosyl hydrolase